MTTRKSYALAVGVLLAAAGLRLWQLGSIPRGLWLDEAFFLLEGQKIVHGQGFPIYFTDNHGIEPLFPYLCSLAELIVGHVSWAGRLITGWLGVIGVACVMRLGKDLFPARKVWLCAGLVTAFFYWDINFSRFSNLPELTTIAAAATLAAFWHGVCTGRRSAYLLAGLCLGLGLSAYAASRLIPLILIGAWLAALIARRGQRHALFVGGLLTLATALLIYSPLIWFFSHNPKWFFLRYDETTTSTLGAAAALSNLLNNAIKTFTGLFWAGDTNWRHNLAGRPALDTVQAVLFLIGLSALARRWRKAETWVLFLWLVIGLSLSVVTEAAPHFGRTTMAIPAITLIIGAGMAALWQWPRHWSMRGPLITALILSALLTTYDYFGRWAKSPALDQAFLTDQQQVALALRAEPPANTLYATPLYLNRWDTYWNIEYLVGEKALPNLREFNGNLCTLLPAYVTRAATYAVVEPDDEVTPAILKEVFPMIIHHTAGALSQGKSLEIYTLPAGQAARLPVTNPITATFGDLAQLQGYSLEADSRPGGQIGLTVGWKMLRATASPYKVFVHVLGKPQPDNNTIYAQQDAEPCANRYSTEKWRPGESLLDHYQLALPGDLPPGIYTLTIGWYNETAGRLSITDAAGQSAGDALTLEQIRIAQP